MPRVLSPRPSSSTDLAQNFADASHLSFELDRAYVLSVEEARQRQWLGTGIVEPGLDGLAVLTPSSRNIGNASG